MSGCRKSSAGLSPPSAAVPDETPALYCARQILVDGTLNRIGLSAPLGGPARFPASLTQNIATGNTVVAQPGGDPAGRRQPRRRAKTWHDWWCYMMVTRGRRQGAAR